MRKLLPPAWNAAAAYAQLFRATMGEVSIGTSGAHPITRQEPASLDAAAGPFAAHRSLTDATLPLYPAYLGFRDNVSEGDCDGESDDGIVSPPDGSGYTPPWMPIPKNPSSMVTIPYAGACVPRSESASSHPHLEPNHFKIEEVNMKALYIRIEPMRNAGPLVASIYEGDYPDSPDSPDSILEPHCYFLYDLQPVPLDASSPPTSYRLPPHRQNKDGEAAEYVEAEAVHRALQEWHKTLNPADGAPTTTEFKDSEGDDDDDDDSIASINISQLGSSDTSVSGGGDLGTAGSQRGGANGAQPGGGALPVDPRSTGGDPAGLVTAPADLGGLGTAPSKNEDADEEAIIHHTQAKALQELLADNRRPTTQQAEYHTYAICPPLDAAADDAGGNQVGCYAHRNGSDDSPEGGAYHMTWTRERAADAAPGGFTCTANPKGAGWRGGNRWPHSDTIREGIMGTMGNPSGNIKSDEYAARAAALYFVVEQILHAHEEAKRQQSLPGHKLAYKITLSDYTAQKFNAAVSCVDKKALNKLLREAHKGLEDAGSPTVTIVDPDDNVLHAISDQEEAEEISPEARQVPNGSHPPQHEETDPVVRTTPSDASRFQFVAEGRDHRHGTLPDMLLSSRVFQQPPGVPHQPLSSTPVDASARRRGPSTPSHYSGSTPEDRQMPTRMRRNKVMHSAAIPADADACRPGWGHFGDEPNEQLEATSQPTPPPIPPTP